MKLSIDEHTLNIIKLLKKSLHSVNVKHTGYNRRVITELHIKYCSHVHKRNVNPITIYHIILTIFATKAHILFTILNFD